MNEGRDAATSAKEYLSQIRKLDIMIQQKVDQLQELQAKAEGVGSMDYSADRVQTSPVDSMSKNVISIVDLEADIRRKLNQYIQTKTKIIDEIQALDDAKHIEILYKRYVEYKTITAVAYEMGYEYTWLCHLHGDALAAFTDKYLKTTNKHKGE